MCTVSECYELYSNMYIHYCIRTLCVYCIWMCIVFECVCMYCYIRICMHSNTVVFECACTEYVPVLYSNVYCTVFDCIWMCTVFDCLYCMYCIRTCVVFEYALYSNVYTPVQLQVSYNYCNVCSYSNSFILNDVREYIIHMI